MKKQTIILTNNQDMLSDFIAQFINDCKVRGLSKDKIQSYSDSLK